MTDRRKAMAKVARQLYAEEITYEQWGMAQDEDESDELVCELSTLVEHQPSGGGWLARLFGQTEASCQAYRDDVFEVIERLENETT